MSENNADQVSPVDPDTNEIPTFVAAAPAASRQPPVWVWFGLGGLLLLALLVIFVLPTLVTEYELPLERRVDVADLQVLSQEEETIVAISPFDEAQRSLRRREAMDILAELLEVQGELEALEVERWGQQPYQEALEQASIGDEYYRTQDFVLASESYQRGRDGLISLRDALPTVLQQTLVSAQAALSALDSAGAQDLFSLALLLEPDSEVARIGLTRARAMDDVTALFAAAEELLEDGELEAARDLYQQVLALDAYNEMAQAMLAEVAVLITEAEFARIMSRGYASLQQGDPEQAIATFEEASNLGVNQEQALAAITQTQTEVANARINALRESIAGSEAAENWQDAVDNYDRVLAIDANLIFAINGRDYAAKRAQLDSLLSDAIANPERFAEDAVFQQTLDVYYTGRNIEDAGSKLLGQLDELEQLLENSQIPVDIALVSDNLTDVTLMRVGNLGNFEQTSVSLKPGRYVAVGRRAGYREVREEFTVGFGLTPSSVVVQCVERVVVTSR